MPALSLKSKHGQYIITERGQNYIWVAWVIDDDNGSIAFGTKDINGVYAVHRANKPARYTIDLNELARYNCRDELDKRCSAFYFKQEWMQHDKHFREYGPSIVWLDGKELWIHEEKDYTDAIARWRFKVGIPPWQYWTDKEKMLFKLKFW